MNQKNTQWAFHRTKQQTKFVEADWKQIEKEWRRTRIENRRKKAKNHKNSTYETKLQIFITIDKTGKKKYRTMAPKPDTQFHQTVINIAKITAKKALFWPKKKKNFSSLFPASLSSASLFSVVPISKTVLWTHSTPPPGHLLPSGKSRPSSTTIGMLGPALKKEYKGKQIKIHSIVRQDDHLQRFRMRPPGSLLLQNLVTSHDLSFEVLEN